MKRNLLSAKRVASIIKNKEFGWHHDGGGLYLVGSEEFKTFSWTTRIYRNTVTGRPRDYGHGPVDLLTLQQAREKSREVRQLALSGIDPVEQRKNLRREMKAQAAARVTFKDAVDQFLEVHTETWKNKKHRAQWRSTLDTYAKPLMHEPVTAIDEAAITGCLASIWTSKQETAARTKQRIIRVVDWIKAGKPLPQLGASKRVTHHPAMPFGEIPAFMEDLRKRDRLSARALELTILTACRTGEMIGAKWDEIDLDSSVWTVPGERMKADRAHRIPLSRRAVEILRGLHHDQSGFIFPGAKKGRHLGDEAMRRLLRGMSGNGYTVHGFRSAFTDWARETTNTPRDVVEMALAHAIKDKTEAAYRRGDALPKRAKLMEQWAAHCSSKPVEATVTKLVVASGQ